MQKIQERMTKVKLYGKLRKFGREFDLYVKSPAEAVHALGKMIPGFKHYMENAHNLGMEFAIFNGKRNITEEELHLGAKPEIRIAPVYGGRKSSGVIQTIIGVAIFAAGAALAYFSAGSLSGVGVAMMKFGAAVALGGVVQMLTPGAKSLNTDSDSENTASYAFGGPVNTTAQGTPVPVFYGYREVGGAVISAGMYSSDIT